MHPTLRSSNVHSRVSDVLTRHQLADYIRAARRVRRGDVAKYEIGPPFNAADVRGREGYARLRVTFFQMRNVGRRPYMD